MAKHEVTGITMTRHHTMSLREIRSHGYHVSVPYNVSPPDHVPVWNHVRARDTTSCHVSCMRDVDHGHIPMRSFIRQSADLAPTLDGIAIMASSSVRGSVSSLHEQPFGCWQLTRSIWIVFMASRAAAYSAVDFLP